MRCEYSRCAAVRPLDNRSYNPTRARRVSLRPPGFFLGWPAILLSARLFSVFVFFHTLLAGCGGPRSDRAEGINAGRDYTVKLIGRIHKQEMAESSGLALANDQGTAFWTHGDGGSPNSLYRISRTGELLATVPVEGASNEDWEDITRDAATGRLFIGDFGNNRNARRDLRVFVFNPAAPGRVDTIRFKYPDQHAFPPHKHFRNFDCEACYYDDGKLHLFTKNRGKGGLYTKQYTLPAKAGTYTATLVDSLELETWVTAADISPDHRSVALLGYGFVYIFAGDPSQPVFDRKRSRIALASTGQAEALTFLNNTDLLLSNENGKLFEIKRKQLAAR